MCSTLICNSRNLGLSVAAALLLVLFLFYLYPTPALLFYGLIPLLLGIVFLALWALTTATGLHSWNALFLLLYVVSVALIDCAVKLTLNHVQQTAQLQGLLMEVLA